MKSGPVGIGKENSLKKDRLELGMAGEWRHHDEGTRNYAPKRAESLGRAYTVRVVPKVRVAKRPDLRIHADLTAEEILPLRVLQACRWF